MTTHIQPSFSHIVLPLHACRRMSPPTTLNSTTERSRDDVNFRGDVKKVLERLRVLSPRFEQEEKMVMRRRVSDVFPAAKHQKKERENTKKKMSSRASVYMYGPSISVSSKNVDKRATPKTRNIPWPMWGPACV